MSYCYLSFITTTTLFILFYLCYVTYLVKLARYLMWPHHRLTALLYFDMRACKCQLFIDEGSCRLPKRLNYCFGVLASARNRSIRLQAYYTYGYGCTTLTAMGIPRLQLWAYILCLQLRAYCATTTSMLQAYYGHAAGCKPTSGYDSCNHER